MSSIGRIEDVLIRGVSLGRQVDVSEAVRSMAWSEKTSGAAQLQIDLEDPGLEILRSGLFADGTAVDYEGRELIVAATAVDGGDAGRGGLTVKCRSKAVDALKARTGSLVMRGASPSTFVQAEVAAVGGLSVVEASASRSQVARDTDESVSGASRPSSWSTFVRLAREIGYSLFETSDTIVFARQAYLAALSDPLQVTLGAGDDSTDLVGVPTCRRSRDTPRDVEISGELPLERAPELYVGAPIELLGVPTFEDTYLLVSLDWEVRPESLVSFTARLPIDPDPQA